MLQKILKKCLSFVFIENIKEFFDIFSFARLRVFVRAGIYARISTHDPQTLPM